MIPRAVDKRGPSSFVTMQKRVWKLRHSYGILLYARSTRQFLVIQNRDSQAFLFFFMIRDLGTWSTDRIISLMRGCTQDEIQRLLFYPFEDVYNFIDSLTIGLLQRFVLEIIRSALLFPTIVSPYAFNVSCTVWNCF